MGTVKILGKVAVQSDPTRTRRCGQANCQRLSRFDSVAGNTAGEGRAGVQQQFAHSESEA